MLLSFPVFPQMVINSNSDSIKPEQRNPAGGYTNGKSWPWNNGNCNRQLVYTTKKMMYSYWQCCIWVQKADLIVQAGHKGGRKPHGYFSWLHHCNFCHLNLLLQFTVQISYKLERERQKRKKKEKKTTFCIWPTGIHLFFFSCFKGQIKVDTQQHFQPLLYF